MPLFHVRPGRQDEFLHLFRQKLGRHFVALPCAAAEELELFGPGKLSAPMESRIGNYLGISRNPAALIYVPPSGTPTLDHVGFHGGLHPAEMRVPLFLA